MLELSTVHPDVGFFVDLSAERVYLAVLRAGTAGTEWARELPGTRAGHCNIHSTRALCHELTETLELFGFYSRNSYYA